MRTGGGGPGIMQGARAHVHRRAGRGWLVIGEVRSEARIDGVASPEQNTHDRERCRVEQSLTSSSTILLSLLVFR